MSQRYSLLAVVKHTVTDTVTLTVEAETEEEAMIKAEEGLAHFPKEQPVEEIRSCYIENREYLDTKVVSVERLLDVET